MEKIIEEEKNVKSGGGLRYNNGKLRYDLVQPLAHRDMVKVLTAGANKYRSRNWESGMEWTTILASLKRHLSSIEAGEDYDKETGLLHISHLACNAHFLNAYYYIYPQGDDRPKRYLNLPNIGLDIDCVLADFVGGWSKRYDILATPESWHFDREISDRFEAMRKTDELDEFYLGLKPLVLPKDIPFEPHCYITARPVDCSISERWLDNYGFPAKPVYCVGSGLSKVDAAKQSGIEIFIDDSYENFIELNRNGIFTYLYTAKHNERFDVGHMRVNSLKELPLLA